MSETTENLPAPPPPAETVAASWVDQTPQAIRPFLQLARLDRPIGTWLLLFPCWWSVALAEVSENRPYPNLYYLVLFAVGALLMRSAGCAYNDWVDRDYDGAVQRTADRPIPSGRVSPDAALIFAAMLAFAAFFVLLAFNSFTVMLGIASLALVLVYPFMKRVTNWPQLVLGLAFNWGALMGWAAVKGSLDIAPALLYVGAICWTIGYDTIYAHQDAEDDASIGIKSTALRFGDDTITWVGGFYSAAILFWMAAGFFAGTHLFFYMCLALVSLQMAWQVSTLDVRDPQNCLWRFRSNRDVGLALFLGLVADMLLTWWSGA